MKINFNTMLFIIGFVGVGIVTNWNGWALFWTFIAALQFTVTLRKKYD